MDPKTSTPNNTMPPAPATTVEKTEAAKPPVPVAEKTVQPSQPPVSVTPPPAAPPAGAGDMPADDHKKSTMMMLLMGLIVILVVAGVFIMRGRGGDQAAQPATGQTQPTAVPVVSTAPVMEVMPTIDPTQPLVMFSAVAETPAYAVDQEITVDIKANSQGADIEGYDLLFPYDKAVYEIVNVTSALPSFQIFPYEKEGYYSVTGIKNLNTQEPTPFADTPILTMTLKVKQPGMFKLEFMSERGKETSKFVDHEINILRPQLQPIELEIR